MANPGPASQVTPNLVTPLALDNVPGRLIYPGGHITAISAPTMGGLSFQYVQMPLNFSATRLDILMAQSMSSSAANNTWGQAITMMAGVYSNQGTYLSLLSSGSTQTTYSVASNSAGNISLSNTAVRPVSCPVGMNFYPGEYLVGVAYSSATSSMGTATTANNITQSMYGPATLDMQTALNIVSEYTMATASNSGGIYQGMGVYSATTGAIPATVAVTDITQTGAALLQANIALVFRNQ